MTGPSGLRTLLGPLDAKFRALYGDVRVLAERIAAEVAEMYGELAALKAGLVEALAGLGRPDFGLDGFLADAQRAAQAWVTGLTEQAMAAASSLVTANLATNAVEWVTQQKTLATAELLQLRTDLSGGLTCLAPVMDGLSRAGLATDLRAALPRLLERGTEVLLQSMRPRLEAELVAWLHVLASQHLRTTVVKTIPKAMEAAVQSGILGELGNVAATLQASLTGAFGDGDASASDSMVGEVLGLVADTVAVPVSDALSTLLRGAVQPAVQRVGGAVQSLTDPLKTGLLDQLQSILGDTGRLRPTVAGIVRRAFGTLRSTANLRFPDAVVTSLADRVEMEVDTALATAHTEVQTFIRGRVEGLAMGAVSAADVTTIADAFTAEVRTGITGLVAQVAQIAQSGIDEVQSCVAALVFSPTVPALLVNLTDTVLGEVTAALQAVLSQLSGLVDGIATDLPNGVQQVIDYLAALVESAPDVLRDTVLQLVETVQVCGAAPLPRGCAGEGVGANLPPPPFT